MLFTLSKKPASRWLTASLLSAAALFSGAVSAQTLQFATAFPESDFSSTLVKRWTEGVTQETGGRIKFRIHWAGSLVGNKMVDGMRDGVVDAALSFTPYVSGEIVDLAPMDVPFSFPTEAKALGAFNSEARPILDAIYEKRGSRVVAVPPVLLPDPVTCRDRFVSGPDQWKGVKIRTAGRWQAETIKRWGGSPTVIPPAELYTALDRGTVDCTLMIYNGVLSLKLYEPARFVTRNDHSIAAGSINVSNAVWNKLSDADRKIMLKVGDEVAQWGISEYARIFNETLKRLSDAGAKFCAPDAKEFARLVAAANDVFEKEITPKASAEGRKLIELINRYRGQVVARPTVGEAPACPS
jgi:TRAP-type C4-dicarboxylate transport system substrate-binding protein